MQNNIKAVCFNNAGDDRKIWMYVNQIFAISEPLYDSEKAEGLSYIHSNSGTIWCVKNTPEEIMLKIGWKEE